MWSSVDNTSLYGSQERKNGYKIKQVRDWDGEDCLDWASEAEHLLCIPLSSWVSISAFQRLSGRDLLRYNVSDFRRIVDDAYGPKFFKLFRTLVKERREDKAEKAISPIEIMDSLMNDQESLEGSNWFIPQVQLYPEDDSSMGSYFGDIAINPSESFPSSPFPTLHYPSSPGYMLTTETDSIGCTPSVSSKDCCSIPADAFKQPGFRDFPSTSDCNTYISDGGEMSESFLDSFDMSNLGVLENNLLEETFNNLDQFLHNEEMDFFYTDPGVNNCQALVNNDLDENFPVAETSIYQDMLKKITTGKRGNRVRHPQSWEFLVRLLLNPATNPSLVRWEDKSAGIFRLVQKEEVASLWGSRSQKHKDEPLSYDNFARILRYHYKSKVLLPVSDKHLVYKLGDTVIESLRRQDLI